MHLFPSVVFTFIFGFQLIQYITTSSFETFSSEEAQSWCEQANKGEQSLYIISTYHVSVIVNLVHLIMGRF
jgi:hypothetical protein